MKKEKFCIKDMTKEDYRRLGYSLIGSAGVMVVILICIMLFNVILDLVSIQWIGIMAIWGVVAWQIFENWKE